MALRIPGPLESRDEAGSRAVPPERSNRLRDYERARAAAQASVDRAQAMVIEARAQIERADSLLDRAERAGWVTRRVKDE